MRITLKWLNKHRTPRGGFSRAQIEALGLTWPPQSGWLKNHVGREISDEIAQQFAMGAYKLSIFESVTND